LDRLVAGHLLEPDGDRYRMHDLLRAYAVGLSFVDDPAPERPESITRGLDNRPAGAVSAMDRAYAFDRCNRPPFSLTPHQFSPPIEDAGAWLGLGVAEVERVRRQLALVAR
jgi:hypothetical protein